MHLGCYHLQGLLPALLDVAVLLDMLLYDADVVSLGILFGTPAGFMLGVLAGLALNRFVGISVDADTAFSVRISRQIEIS